MEKMKISRHAVSVQDVLIRYEEVVSESVSQADGEPLVLIHGLAESSRVNPQVAIYLNRLSDLLFVWARLCNDAGKNDVLWVPGKFRTVSD